MKLSRTGFDIGAFIVICGGALLICHNAAADEGVRLTDNPSEGVVRIEVNGKLFTEYHYKDVPKPYYYPVLGPDELAMTRKWPMETTVQDEEHDHKHHRSLWYGHQSVNGLDFWDEEPKACKTVHTGFQEIKSGRVVGIIKSTDNWISQQGEVICSDERTFRVYDRPGNERLFDFDITLHAPAGKPVVFGDNKDGTMATRVAESMRLVHGKNKPGQGHIVLSTGLRDEETWGKRADWCDYYGPVDQKIVGIAIFDHPLNPRHPTWWHVRDYGLFAANPYGVHDFEHKPPGTGDLTIPAGESISYRYRFYIHEGNEQQAAVGRHYMEYSVSQPAD